MALNERFQEAASVIRPVPHWFRMICNLNVLHSTNRAIALPRPPRGTEDHQLRVDNFESHRKLEGGLQGSSLHRAKGLQRLTGWIVEVELPPCGWSCPFVLALG